MKLENVAVVDKRWVADGLANYLKEHGIPAKIVCKTAVQVHPQKAESARELLKEFKWK